MHGHKIIAQKSTLGWLLSGKFKLINPIPVQLTAFITDEDEDKFEQLSKQIQAFWEIEHVDVKNILDPDDQFCEEYFRSTYYRDETGRFVVRLPFKPGFGNYIHLGNSRDMAVNTWLSTERRMKKNTDFKAKYVDIMDKLIEQNYMQLVPPSEIPVLSEKSCYLTHHLVSKRACEVANRDMYVDDLFTGCHDIQAAIQTSRQLILFFRSAGMELSKWLSNNKELLDSLSTDLSDHSIELGESNLIKTLGIFWSTQTDEFGYHHFGPESWAGTITCQTKYKTNGCVFVNNYII
ncbi:hypothetical protein Bhyg_04712 [Pseudolycoriella hygida]|uniref:Uncharacterized protein n=1 Tax=Pseudolycoriella hygida TaxID=35572 RepID=A0A9Q0NH42_9DIPT|nr:hypothetical protein Bhyg_04712 [Pseudolycoriella hygida]